MRVLQLTGGISPRYGGSQALLGMCRELRRLGVETHIATTDADTSGRLTTPLGQLGEVQGSLVYHFSSPFLPKYGFSPQLSRWLGTHLPGYDILHFHGLYSHALLAAVPRARRRNMPYIVRPMGALAAETMDYGRIKKEVYFRLFGRRYLSGAAAIHYTSWEEQAEAELLGVHAPAVVIPLGIDEDAFKFPPRGRFRQRFSWIGDRKIVLYLSRLDPIKGLEPLLESMKSLGGQRSDFVFVIAGHGPREYEQKIRKAVRNSRLADRTIFTGFVDGAEKAALLKDADLFVLPSYHENFGMAIVEAMAAGLPVVISSHVKIHGEIAEAEAGLVVPSQTPAISHSIAALLDDDAFRLRMGENAARLVVERFRWRTIAPRVVDLYQSLLRKSGPGTLVCAAPPGAAVPRA